MNDADRVAIGPGSAVTLHFAIELTDGSVVDSNFAREPAQLVMGDGNLPEGFERLLLGLRAGDERRFEVPAAQGFGFRQRANVMTLPKRRFPAEMALTPGLVVTFTDAASGQLPGVVMAVHGEQVSVDFNHPLAGKTLVFAVAIRSVAAERVAS
ncbi:MAG: peptidylprolyl isomerase [Porticoccaceae bacterium]